MERRPMPKYLDIIDLCAMLRVTDRTLRNWRVSGEFPEPDLQCGKSLRWKESTIRKWMQDHAPKRRGRAPAYA